MDSSQQKDPIISTKIICRNSVLLDSQQESALICFSRFLALCLTFSVLVAIYASIESIQESLYYVRYTSKQRSFNTKIPLKPCLSLYMFKILILFYALLRYLQWLFSKFYGNLFFFQVLRRILGSKS